MTTKFILTAENREFAALRRAAGWKGVETARRLGLKSSSVISQYENGRTQPSAQVIQLFKMILADEKPKSLGGVEQPGREIVRETQPEESSRKDRVIDFEPTGAVFVVHDDEVKADAEDLAVIKQHSSKDYQVVKSVIGEFAASARKLRRKRKGK